MSYEDVVQAIEAVPITYLPALLLVIVRRCVQEKVFVEGGLEKTVRRGMAASV